MVSSGVGRAGTVGRREVEGQLGPEDGAQTHLGRGLGEADHPVHAVVVGEGKGLEPEPDRDRAGEHPQGHLASYSGLFQADAYGGYGRLYDPGRNAGPILEAACWVHARRPFFVMADLAENTRRKAQADPEKEIAFLILLDALIFRTESEIRWLDACEARIRHRSAKPPGDSKEAAS